MKLNKVLTLLVLFSSLHFCYAQNNQILYHFPDGTTEAEIIAFAASWNSVVLNDIPPGGNLALIQANYYPFPDPLYPGEMVVDVNAQLERSNKDQSSGDGGAINREILPSYPKTGGSACISDYVHNIGPNTVSVGVYDTGVNWQIANNGVYNFNVVDEGDGANDENGHGTHVASVLHSTYLVPGSTYNHIEYYVENPLVSGAGTLAEVAFAIDRAIRAEVNVVNCSFGYWGSMDAISNGGNETNSELTYVDPLFLTMSQSDPQKTLFICSAGNENIDLSGFGIGDQTKFPAAFGLENMITVGSHDCGQNLSSFSNYDASVVDIAAPGENIPGIDQNGNYFELSGTSQSTALVSGAATIVGSEMAVFDAAVVKCAILSGADISSELMNVVANGRYLNIAGAVQSLMYCANQSGGGTLPGPSGHVEKRSSDSRKVIEFKTELMPNPCIDQANLIVDISNDDQLNITVITSAGQPVLSFDQSVQQGENNISIDFSNLAASSIYFVRIQSDTFVATEKISRIK